MIKDWHKSPDKKRGPLGIEGSNVQYLAGRNNRD
jgi:hypothetical protein